MEDARRRHDAGHAPQVPPRGVDGRCDLLALGDITFVHGGAAAVVDHELRRLVRVLGVSVDDRDCRTSRAGPPRRRAADPTSATAYQHRRHGSAR